jgi:hypothetical protein
MKNTIELKKRYEKIVNEYTKIFAKKQELELDYWVAGCIGDVGAFGDYYFSFSDIYYDVNSNQPKWQILDWHDESVESKEKINYYSYSRGWRFSDLKKRKK